MSHTDHLLANNREHVAATSPSELPAPPSLGVVVVTCMDARLDPAAALGLEPGQAHVLRNAGGVVSDDTIRSLAISQHKLGTREIMVMHHTRCGMQGLDDGAFAAELEANAGTAPPFAIGGFADLEEDVRASVRRIRESPFVPFRDAVRGFVYDVDTHAVTEVDGE